MNVAAGSCHVSNSEVICRERSVAWRCMHAVGVRVRDLLIRASAVKTALSA